MLPFTVVFPMLTSILHGVVPEGITRQERCHASGMRSVWGVLHFRGVSVTALNDERERGIYKLRFESHTFI